MIQSLKTMLLWIVIAATSFGGLIVQPTDGNASVKAGQVVPFDLIIANETTPAHDWTYQAIGPFNFCTETGGSELLGSGGVTYAFGPQVPPGQPTNLPSSTIAVAPGWSMNSGLFAAEGAIQYQADVANGTPQETTTSGNQFLFGRVWINIPAGYTGSFSFTLGQDSLGDDLQLTNSLGQNATAVPPANDPVPDWIDDAHPPVGNCAPPPPGGSANDGTRYTFTAVPEPSGFLFMSCIGIVIGGVRFYRRKLNIL